MKLGATDLLSAHTEADGVVTARVIPITMLDEGRFHDAGVYKATPKPMALDAGVVYEAQKSGQPFGYVTITSAGKAGSWSSLGKWQLASAMPKATPLAPPSAELGAVSPLLRP